MKKTITIVILALCYSMLMAACTAPRAEEQPWADKQPRAENQPWAEEQPKPPTSPTAASQAAPAPAAEKESETITCDTAVKEIYKPIERGGKEYLFQFEYDLSFVRDYRTNAKDEEYISDGNSKAKVNLSVYAPGGSLLQTIPFESGCDWNKDVFERLNLNEWKVLDINFDGYQDIICLSWAGGAKANWFYVGWLWNPYTFMFEKTNIDEIYNLSVHASDKSLRSVSGSGGRYHYEIYRFIDGEFVMTNKLIIGGENVLDDDGVVLCNYIRGGTAVREFELLDGALKEVFPDVICDTEEGREVIFNRLYGDDSIWFGVNSPNFYGSAYGDGLAGEPIERDEE